MVVGFIFQFIWKCLKAVLVLLLVIALLPLFPNLPPDFKFTSQPAPELAELKGKIAINSLLNRAERLFEGEIIGPEGFAILNGELYTTLHGGYVAKVVGSKIQPVVKFGQACDGLREEAKCGRPLGIFAGSDGLLYVVDAYYGVFTYNVETDVKERLFGPDTKIGGQSLKLCNSITVATDGTIYWTLSSSDVTLQDGLYSLLADGTGKLISYDRKKKQHKVLIDGLLFANGVSLAPDESFVIVAETGMARLHRYWLKGPKTGQSEVFGDRLPGMPDNLRAGSQGFLVSLVFAADTNTPAITQSILPFPYIRKAVSRALALSENAFLMIDSYYPNVFCKSAVHFIGHFEMTKPLAAPRVTLVVLDVDGNVVDSFHATDGSLAAISDAIVYRGALYLGSPFNRYLGRVKAPEVVARFQKAFPVEPQFTIRSKPTTTTPKPTTTTPKPTTTTPKPTTTTPKPTTTTQKPTTTSKQATTTPKSTTATPKPTTTTPKPPTTTSKPTKTTPKPPKRTPEPTPTPKPQSVKGRDSNEL